MELLNKMKGFLLDDEDNELDIDEEELTKMTKYEQKSEKVPRANIKMVLFEPRTFGEGQSAGASLKERKACVVNLHRLDEVNSQRTIDFLAGVVFAIGGTIQKIGENIILCTPPNVQLSGKIEQ